MIIYRVRAHPFDGEDFVYEGFEKRPEAEAYYAQLQADDRLTDNVPYKSFVVSFEALGEQGDWAMISIRTVIRDD